MVEYGRARAAERGKRINFTLTTNAVALDEETMGYLNEEAISLVLSLDGRPEVHDRFRPGPDGQGSYDRVVAGIQRAVASRAQRQLLRARHLYPLQPGLYRADVRHLLALGLDRLSLEPVVALPDEAYALREGDLPRGGGGIRAAGRVLPGAGAGRPSFYLLPFRWISTMGHAWASGSWGAAPVNVTWR